MAAETVEQIAMGGGINQRALIMLSVQLDQRAADIAHQGDTGRLVVDEDPRAPIGHLHTAQDDVAIIVDGVLSQHSARRMIGRHIEDRGHLPCLTPWRTSEASPRAPEPTTGRPAEWICRRRFRQ
jgi:hypothetical protein